MRALDDWRLPPLSWKLTLAEALALEGVLPETLCPVDSRVKAGTMGSGGASSAMDASYLSKGCVLSFLADEIKSPRFHTGGVKKWRDNGAVGTMGRDREGGRKIC